MRCLLLLLLPLLQGLSALSQTDTIALAQQLAWQKEFKAANDLLAIYNSHHADVNGIRLQAQVLHWMGQSNKAISLLKPAVDQFPEYPAVRLDYARVLFESGRINQAKAHYALYLPTDSTNPEALLNTAYIDRWNGKTSKAAAAIQSFLQLYPTNQAARDLQQAMKQDQTPWIKPGFSYLSDDQPLQVPSVSLEAGWYKSWALAPTVAARWNSMQSSTNNSSVQVLLANQFYIGATGTTLQLGGGLISQEGETKPLAQLGLKQKLASHFWLDLGWEKRAYQHTVLSTQNLLMQQFTYAALRYNKDDKWMAQAQYENQRFDDGNNVKTIYAWFMIPVLQLPKWRLSTGYSIVYADADTNTFRPKKTLSEIVATGLPIAGIYDPYFTPTNQLTHSLLAASSLSLSNAVVWELRASGAFAGKADNPYFYLTQNGNQYQLSRSFYQQSYHPFELYTAINWTTAQQSKLSIYYQFSSLLFYIRHIAGVTFKIPLRHGGK
jgi:thioredoxin-like negative regulator of GroEL